MPIDFIYELRLYDAAASQHEPLEAGPTRCRSATESDHGTADPLQRLRHELRRPSVARAVGASARPVLAVQGPRLLDRIWRRRWSAGGSTASSSPTCWASTTSISGNRDGGDPARRADPGQRSAAARPRHGAGDRASRLRHHGLDLASSTPIPSPGACRRSITSPRGASAGTSSPSYLDSGARNIGQAAQVAPRRPLRRRRRIYRGALQAVGRQLGRRRGAARPGAAHLHRSGQGP